jgi:AcrR family transcriptional regulator
MGSNTDRTTAGAGAGDGSARRTPSRPRRRNPEASRAAILEAAREVFTERGYARGTIREIAKRAGVTHGLVMRHFGSKERLLIAALPGPRALPDAITGDLESLPERVAAEFVSQIDAPEGFNTLIAMIRSGAGGDEAVVPLYTELERQTGAIYRDVLGPEADAHVDLLRSLLIGVAFSRQVARTGPMSTMTSEELAAHLAPAIRGVLGPALSSA